MPQSNTRTALITGATGQDGAYLSEFLLAKNYVVHGVSAVHHRSTLDASIIFIMTCMSAAFRFILHYGDVTDATNLIRIVQEIRPDEIYNLAAQSHVQVSASRRRNIPPMPTPSGRLRLLEAIRILGPNGHDALLSGVDVGALRQCSGISAIGDDAISSPQPVRCGQALCLLDHGQLSRGLWHACLERHPVQS